MKRIMNKIDYDFWWEKIADYAKLVGRTTARPVLLLYYVPVGGIKIAHI